MPRTPPDPDLLHDAYIDETSQTKHRFLGLGGLVMPTRHAGLFVQRVMQARGADLPAGELAWTKVSKAKLPAYKRVVDFVAHATSALPSLQFHSLFVDTSKINDHRFNDGSRDVGFNKEVYQLGMKIGRLYPQALFHTYLDERSTKSRPEDLRDLLNFGLRKNLPDRDFPFRRVHFRNSSKCQCLQVVDVVLGGLAYHINGHRHVADASPAKCELSDYILAAARIRDVHQGTNRTGSFTVWHRQLKK